MQTLRKNLSAALRIIWTIAAKDVADAITSKTALTVIAGALFIVRSSQALPFLLSRAARPTAIIYEAGDSHLAAALQASGGFQVTRVKSQQELEETLVRMNAPILGLAVPADLNATLASGEQPELEGYVVWARRTAAPQLQADWEQRIARALGRTARIHVEGNLVYPDPHSPGLVGTFAGTLLVTILVIGGLVVPYLVLEEKQNKTLDALLVSPASVGQVVAGKALAGLFLCLAAAGVALACQWPVVVHWGLAVLVVVFASLLAVAVGLLLGMLFETAQEMGLWVGIPLLVSLVPMILMDRVAVLPAPLPALIPWIPTVAAAQALLVSFSGRATVAQVAPELAIVLACALLVYALLVWKVRRSDR